MGDSLVRADRAQWRARAERAESEVKRLCEGTYTDAESRTWWSDAYMKQAEARLQALEVAHRSVLQCATDQRERAEQAEAAVESLTLLLESQRSKTAEACQALAQVEAERDEAVRALAAEVLALRAEAEAHRQAQAAIYRALGPEADPNRETWPGQIAALRARRCGTCAHYVDKSGVCSNRELLILRVAPDWFCADWAAKEGA